MKNIILTIATFFLSPIWTISINANKIQLINKLTMGVSIVLYRVNTAENIDSLVDISNQMDTTKSVDLYKIEQDLSLIFLNTTEPYDDKSTIPYKMLFGNYVFKEVDGRIIGGFVPTSEVSLICNWIKDNQIDTYEGFSKIYDGTSSEVKQELEDIGADDKAGLFDGYVKPLTDFYFDALKDKNSIVICGE
jgi:hypothetical protein